MAKLAKKGKKIKVVDSDDEKNDLNQRSPRFQPQDEGAASSAKLQDTRERSQEEEQRLAEHQRQIEETNAQLTQEAKKREDLEKLLAEMEHRMVSGGNALEEKEREQAAEQRRLQLELEEEKNKQRQLLEEKAR